MAGCGLADRADQVARPRLGSLPRDTRTAMQKVRMWRPSAAREALGLSPLVEARRAAPPVSDVFHS
jgi:hypothetical protein